MEKIRAMTGAEAGLSSEEQIRIALQTMMDHDGKASMEEIYRDVEAHMNGNPLSHQGKASLRYFINKTAVEKKYVYPYNNKDFGWRITPQGKFYLEQNQVSKSTSQNGAKYSITQTMLQLSDTSADEKIEQTTQGVEEEDTVSDDVSDQKPTKPYDPSQINVVSKPMPVFQVMRKIRLGEIELHPDFQRLVVWNQTRKSRLIESILIRIPLPSFYLDAVNPDKWLVIDGLQRLFTLHEFCNENQLRLTNLEFLETLIGKTFNELPRNFQRDIEETHLSLYIIQPDTPSNVKFTIFSRVNTGGLVLKPQEIRHALFQGHATKLLQDLAISSAFQSATTNSISPTRMDDRECVLRFLAFYLNDYKQYQDPDFNGFLSEVMQFINELAPPEIIDPPEIMELQQVFFEAMNKAESVFGQYAFRKLYETDGKRAPINKSLFEVWSVSLQKYPLGQLVQRKDEIIKEFIDVMNQDKDFESAISQGTGSIKKVEKRFSTIENLLKRIME